MNSIKKHRGKTQYEIMTEIPVEKLVFLLGVPSTVSMLISHIYNAVDTYFVGRLGTSASGAVGIVFGIMAFLQAFAFMYGQGAGNIISRLLGSKNEEKANVVASTAIIGSFSTGIIISVAGIICIRPLLFLMGSTDTIYPFAKSYALWIFATAPFIMCSLTLNNLFRYQGKSYLGTISIITGAVLNMVLDPILMFRFGLGINGAGISTAVSQLIGFLVIITLYQSRYSELNFSFPDIHKIISIIPRICATGLPALSRQGLGSISTMLLNRQARIFGDIAVAAMSIVNRIVFLAFAFALGISQGFQPVAGFNYGAGKMDRVKKGFVFTILVSNIIIIIFAIISVAFSSEIVKVFRDDSEVIEIGKNALVAGAIGTAFLPITVSTNILYQSLGLNKASVLISIMRSGLFFVPIICFLPRILGLTGVIVAQPCADIISFLAAIPFAIYIYKSIGKYKK